jgi:hypothetical protein
MNIPPALAPTDLRWEARIPAELRAQWKTVRRQLQEAKVNAAKIACKKPLDPRSYLCSQNRDFVFRSELCAISRWKLRRWLDDRHYPNFV